jgi:predicted RNase H-like HicB family nuclease
VKYQIAVVIEKGPRNYSAYSPDVEGCISTGQTPEETLENMKEALKAHLEWMTREGDPMPEGELESVHIVEVEVAVPSMAPSAG